MKFKPTLGKLVLFILIMPIIIHGIYFWNRYGNPFLLEPDNISTVMAGLPILILLGGGGIIILVILVTFITENWDKQIFNNKKNKQS